MNIYDISQAFRHGDLTMGQAYQKLDDLGYTNFEIQLILSGVVKAFCAEKEEEQESEK